MRAADSFSSDLHATYGFVRLHLIGVFTPLLAIGLLSSGKLLTGVALAIASPALWIEIAAEHGFERKVLTALGVCCGTVAALLLLGAAFLWWRSNPGRPPWSFF